MPARCTLAQDLRFQGIALHRGGAVSVRLLPADAGVGIVFRRADLGGAEIRCHCRSVSGTYLATTVSDGGARVSTVEHFLSALAALGVDDIVVELDGEEMPILDGSAAPWYMMMRACGLTTFSEKRRYMRIKKPVQIVSDDGRRAAWQPARAQAPSYTVTIDFDHAVIRRTRRQMSFELSAESYRKDISRARTFCYVNDVETMHRNKLALGGSLQNAVVFDDEKVINEDGLRYADEFVRHKILDSIGDCYINGHTVLGDYISESPGHALNNLLMRKLADSPESWEWTE